MLHPSIPIIPTIRNTKYPTINQVPGKAPMIKGRPDVGISIGNVKQIAAIVFIKASIRKYFDTNFDSIKSGMRIYCSCLSVTNMFNIPIAVPVSANPIPAPVGITVNVIKV